MCSLHKKTEISLVNKIYICFIFLICYGVYKNGIVPLNNGYGSIFTLISSIIMPIITFIIGAVLDKHFNNEDMFNSKTVGLLILMSLPISINLFLYIILLGVFLIGYNVLKNKIEVCFNYPVFIHIVFVIFLNLMNHYTYMNSLEIANIFQYSFLDQIMGRNISGIFTSNIFLLIASLLFLLFTYYYKKNIVLSGYFAYVIGLFIYSVMSSNMATFLNNLFSPHVLYALIFIASIPCYSPSDEKKQITYGLTIGILTLPLSILFNFFEGIYISILFVNLFFVFSNFLPQKIKMRIQK